MDKLKSTLTCSYCSKIYKDPIELPCKHNLCKEHLTEKDVTKQNRIKCAECKQDFVVKDNEFKTNYLYTKQLSEQAYLSYEEFTFKKKIQDSIRMIFQMYEEFTLNKTILDLDVHNHFTGIRFKLDEHREVIKEKIDDIYMEMIEETKKFEKYFLKSLEDKLEASLKSSETKSLEQSLIETEDTFRNPNLLIESIRDMQRKQEELISELKLKLDEQSQAKDILINMNEFTPNVSFNQDWFGQLNLNGYSIIDPFKSLILSGNQPSDLIKLCEFSIKDKWTLLYRGTRDGFGAYDFHPKCDNHNKTLTILKAKGSSFIFGGYTAINWDTSQQFKSDPNAFLFSLTNQENQPCKIKQTNVKNSIFCDLFEGPIFGNNDILICHDADTTMDSCSDLGRSYEHPQPSQGKSYLAGSYHFRLSEIEVYQKES
jgi:hypothetical protein